MLFQEGPVQPGDLVVLAVGVVVAELGVAEFISCKEHGCPAAAHKDSAGVADHPHAKGEDLRVIGLPLRSAVPAPVVICTVSVLPAICLIVLFVVGIQIVEREAVMAGEKIDGGVGAPDLRVVDVR